ncbi:MAG: uroporphyrinogen-III synthase [bacterium]
MRLKSQKPLYTNSASSATNSATALPLTGKRVVVTRASTQAAELITSLESAGAHVLHIPTIKLVEPDSWAGCDHAIDEIDSYDWLIFTSTNGATFFLKRLQERGGDFARLAGCKIAAVGEKTASHLRDQGLRVALVPEKFHAEALIRSISNFDLQGKRVLILRPQETQTLLAESISEMGALVDAVSVYKNASAEWEADEPPDLWHAGHVDVLTFTSPSTVRNFVAMVGQEQVASLVGGDCKVAAIGEVTANAITELGLPVDIVPKKTTVPDLVDAIVRYFQDD